MMRGKAFRGALEYVLLALVAALTAALRLVPYLRYGPTLSEVDPYEYLWLANYFYSHGLGGLHGLTHSALWWYPWGRDFLSSEYLGLPWLSALASRLTGASVEVALSLSPVAFAVLGVIGVYLAVKEAGGSSVAALTAAAGFAFLPITVLDHGFATDPAKVFDGIALLPYPLYFMARSYRAPKATTSIAMAAAAGASGGLIAWLWGGYQYMALVVALLAVTEPFLNEPSLPGLLRLLAAWAAFAAVALTSPAVSPHVFTRGVGLAAEASLLAYAFEYLALTRLRGLSRLRVHAWTLAVLAGLAAVAVASGIVSLPSRVLMGLGVTPPPGAVVPLTVQEYMGVPPQQVISSYAPFFVLSLIGVATMIAGRATRRLTPSPTDAMVVVSLELMVIFTYASVNQAYYLPSAALYAIIAGGVSVALVGSLRPAYGAARRRRPRQAAGRGAAIGAALLAAIVLASMAYYASVDYSALQLEAPSIETGWLGALRSPDGKVIVPVNNAWPLALSYVKERTPPGSVVVTWWDYGYWVGVLANRASVVDGSTINGTQIELVADALTAPVEQSGAYLRMLRLPANETYVMVYDVFLGIYDNSTGSVTIMPFPNVVSVGPGVYAVTYGLGDMAKSYQMLRIAGRVNPYSGQALFTGYSSVSYQSNVEVLQFPGLAGGPAKNVSNTLNTTIYDLIMYGLSQLGNYGVLGQGASWLRSASSFTPAAVAYVTPTGGMVPAPVSAPSPEPYYVPVAFFVSVPYSWQGAGVTYFYAVIVFLYRWGGLP